MLRRLEEFDAAGMLEWMHDPLINKQFKTKFSSYQLKDTLEFINSCYTDDNRYFAAVNDNNEYLGTIGLKNISYYNKNAECTFVFRAKVQEKYILEAIGCIKKYAFEEMNLSEIYTHVFEDDEVNISYLQKLGFSKGGTYVGKMELNGYFRNLCWFSAKNTRLNESEHNLIHFQERGDNRGHLVVIEQLKDVPFVIKRLFYIYGSEMNVVRGQHANRKSEFVLVNVAGTSKVRVKDGKSEKVYVLDQPHMGVYLPKMVWKEMYDFSPDSVLLVISNEVYDSEEYIRNYDDYIREIRKEAQKDEQ